MDYSKNTGISTLQTIIFTFFIILSLVYFIRKYGLKKDTILFSLVFFEGLFGIIHSYDIFPIQYYRLLAFAFGFYMYGKYIFKDLSQSARMVNITFFLFTVSFVISLIINGGVFLNVLSQYLYKFSFLFIIYHGLRIRFQYSQQRKRIIKMIITLLFIQVILSVVKILVLGLMEGVVGSLSAKGAAVAVVFPIFAMVLYMLVKSGRLTKKEWLFVFSFFLIAFASLKRSPIFIFPVILLFMAVYVNKTIKLVSAFKFIPLVLFLLYVGIRSNASLNKNREAWGDFDLGYTTSYVLQYNFGVSSTEEIGESNSNTGRGASLFLVFDSDNLRGFSVLEKYFGMGISKFRDKDEQIWIQQNLGHIGVVGFALYQIITLGYVGLITYLVFIFSILFTIKYRRLRNVLIGFILWEIFLYQGFSVTSNAMGLILIAIVFYSNYSKKAIKTKNVKSLI